MSLTLSLNNALSGLKTNQKAISVLSHNIANANTDGYSRQVVDQSAIYIAGTGSGVRVDDVIRKVDKYLQRAVINQSAETGRANVISQYYDRVNVLLGQPGSQNTLDEFMTGFFNAAQTLSETPDRASARSAMIGSATALTGFVSNLAYDVHDLRFEADREMRETVDSINKALTNLDKVNLAINTAGAVGQSTAGLLDQRDRLLNELSGYVDINVNFSGYGVANVTTSDGTALIDGMPRQMRYVSAQSADQFVTNGPVSALMLYTVDSNGNPMDQGVTLISAGSTGNVTSTLTGGKLEGLRLMRDEVLPAMLDQLDQLSANVRDAVNAIHNDGSGFPAASSLTGTRPVVASQSTSWTGTVRIAVLNKDGSPVAANYADESYTGMRPLNLNLASLNSGTTNGRVTMQTIVDEINTHFSSPAPKASLGNINNIRLVSDTNQLLLGASGATFNFDFELENISANPASFVVGGITVRDQLGNNITNVTQGPPQLLLDPASTYYTTAGIPDVTIDLVDSNHGIQVGDTIYLGPPSGSVNGIPAANLTGFFEVVGVGGNSVTFRAKSSATTTGTVADASGVGLNTAFAGADGGVAVAPGQTVRTRDQGQLQVDLSGNPFSAFYDVTVDVATIDEDGNLLTSQVTYRIRNDENNLLNDRYSATGATGDASYVLPTTSKDALRAVLVDENGNELLKVDGNYVDHYPSYLKIFSPTGEYTVSIDEMDSKQIGDIQGDPPTPGTNWGFSHYFGLNDFFAPNELISTGDTVRGSAVNLKVAQRLIDDPNLITTGKLVQTTQPADPNAPPQYTYMRYSGDNTVATKLKALSSQSMVFQAAGGLPTITMTLGGYTSQLLGNIATLSSTASNEASNAQILFDGFKSRADAVSGVNLDEELANTVIFQNSYAATARIVTVVNQMFEDVLQMV